MKLRNLFLLAVVAALTSSCGEFNSIYRSTDINLKYEYAKKYFEQGKYSRSAVLLEDVVATYRGTAKAEEALFLLAQSLYYNKDYSSANQYFKTYYTTYPKGEYVEIAHFNSAYGLYSEAPDYRLDQKPTISAIAEFTNFMELFPNSDKLDLARKYVFELQERLAEKELGSVKLYYNLGNYMGNNYESCIITAKNAIRAYPYSKYLEDFQAYVVRARYELAENSIDQKKPIRYRDVIDDYYNYKNMFPEGKYQKELEKYFAKAEATLKKLPDEMQETNEGEVPTDK